MSAIREPIKSENGSVMIRMPGNNPSINLRLIKAVAEELKSNSDCLDNCCAKIRTVRISKVSAIKGIASKKI